MALSAGVMQRGVRLDQQQEGQGIGLSVAAEIIELYDGELHITTGQKFSGARIELRLPGICY